jgi:hypothetical protein
MHIKALEKLGNLHENRITMLGEEATTPLRPFSVLPEFQYLVASGTQPFAANNEVIEEKWVPQKIITGWAGQITPDHWRTK